MAPVSGTCVMGNTSDKTAKTIITSTDDLLALSERRLMHSIRHLNEYIVLRKYWRMYDEAV